MPLALASTITGSALATDSEEVVLRTSGFTVTTRDFDYYVKTAIPESQRDQALARERAVRDVYEGLYVIKALAARGAENSVIEADELDWMVEHYRDRQLMNLQVKAEVESALAKIDWRAAAEEDYQANKDAYHVPERVSAEHILISSQERSAEEALQRANEVLARLKKGEDFATLAKEYSDDPSAATNSGNLGFFARGKMVGPFEDAAFAMTKLGEISAPVKTDYGYHIIRVNERLEAGFQPFDKVERQIIERLKKSEEQKQRTAIINAVKTGTVDLGLEVNAELLQQTELRYQPKDDKVTTE